MSVEQKEVKRQHERERMHLKRASLDPEKKEAMRKKDREHICIKRATQDPAEREETCRRDRECMWRVWSGQAKKEDEVDKESEVRQVELSQLDAEYGGPKLQPVE